MNPKLAIGTRFWGVSAEKDFPRIHSFIKAANELGHVFVAVNGEEDKIDTIQTFPNVAFPVTPWGKFVFPLNAIVAKAVAAGAEHLLLASAEFPPTEEQVYMLMKHMGNNTLVVGAAFAGHDFYPGATVDGIGTKVPWNTFAIWNLRYLGAIGFPLVGDAPFDSRMAGVEEVSAISVYQTIHGEGLEAKLVRIPEFGGRWDEKAQGGWSDERKAKHAAKIKSKESRPEAQLAYANLIFPTILHLES